MAFHIRCLPCIAARRCLYVEELLAHDRLRPVFLFDAVKTRRVSPAEMTSDPDLRTLQNLNTREDYEAALKMAGLSSR